MAIQANIKVGAYCASHTAVWNTTVADVAHHVRRRIGIVCWCLSQAKSNVAMFEVLIRHEAGSAKVKVFAGQALVSLPFEQLVTAVAPRT
jgi:hypothetical protein